MKKQEYATFLLRLWWNQAEGTWRASLQEKLDGEQHYFATPDALLAFLVTHAGYSASSEPERHQS